MSWNMYLRDLTRVTTEPEEPLEPYHGGRSNYVFNDTLSHKDLRSMGKIPFTTSFHRPDNAHSIGDGARIESIETTERKLNMEDPPPPRVQRKYKPFYTSFHVKPPHSMRLYAKQHYSLGSTAYLEYCRAAAKHRREQAQKEKRHKVEASRTKRRTARTRTPDESLFEQKLTRKLEGTALEVPSARTRSARGAQVPVPKLAWCNQTASDFFVVDEDQGGRGSADEQPPAGPAASGSLRKISFRDTNRPATARAAATPRTSTARTAYSGRSSARSKGGNGFFATEVPSSRVSTARAPRSARRAAWGVNSARGSYKQPHSARSTSTFTKSRRMTKRRARKHQEQNLSPRSRSKIAWDVSKFKPKPFDPTPSLADWEA